jgi:hypothetical protein
MLDLLDYRRRVNNLYAQIRDLRDVGSAWQHFRAVRDDLFARRWMPPRRLPFAA